MTGKPDLNTEEAEVRDQAIRNAFQLLLHLPIINRLPDAGKDAVDGRLHMRVVFPVLIAEEERALTDLIQRRSDLRRRKKGRRKLEHRVLLRNAENLGGFAFGPSDQTVQEDDLPGHFIEGQPVRVRIAFIRPLRVALAALEVRCIDRADVRVQHLTQIGASGAAQ